jgi:hypothetical protein
MKKMIIIFITVSLTTFISCTEEKTITESVPSEVELIADKLIELVDENNISRAEVFVYNYQNEMWISQGECGFELASPFIRVCDLYYNLTNLCKFEFNGPLQLYFKN